MSVVTESRTRLRPWLVSLIDSNQFQGLEWMNKERTKFRIPWKHHGKQDWTPENGQIFMFLIVYSEPSCGCGCGRHKVQREEWARHTGKYNPATDEADYPTWKTRLRCAFNKAPDFQEVKDEGKLDGAEPFRVYILTNDKRSKASASVRRSDSIDRSSSSERKETDEKDTSVYSNMLDNGFPVNGRNGYDQNLLYNSNENAVLIVPGHSILENCESRLTSNSPEWSGGVRPTTVTQFDELDDNSVSDPRSEISLTSLTSKRSMREMKAERMSVDSQPQNSYVYNYDLSNARPVNVQQYLSLLETSANQQPPSLQISTSCDRLQPMESNQDIEPYKQPEFISSSEFLQLFSESSLQGLNSDGDLSPDTGLLPFLSNSAQLLPLVEPNSSPFQNFQSNMPCPQLTGVNRQFGLSNAPLIQNHVGCQQAVNGQLPWSQQQQPVQQQLRSSWKQLDVSVMYCGKEVLRSTVGEGGYMTYGKPAEDASLNFDEDSKSLRECVKRLKTSILDSLVLPPWSAISHSSSCTPSSGLSILNKGLERGLLLWTADNSDIYVLRLCPCAIFYVSDTETSGRPVKIPRSQATRIFSYTGRFVPALESFVSGNRDRPDPVIYLLIGQVVEDINKAKDVVDVYVKVMLKKTVDDLTEADGQAEVHSKNEIKHYCYN